jgi:hypothetical protein
VESINRIVLPGQTLEGPAIPESFLLQLRQYDPSLLVAWNQIKKRFVIEQCVQHLSPGPEHSHVCNRNFVVMAQDDEGVMLPLGDAVMDKIKAADVSRAGFGPDDLEAFLKSQKKILKADQENREKKVDDAFKHGSRFNKRQLLKAKHLIDQHDLRPNR